MPLTVLYQTTAFLDILKPWNHLEFHQATCMRMIPMKLIISSTDDYVMLRVK